MKRDIEKELIAWRNQSDRKGLLIRGARQVGKTYTVTNFGRNEFENLIEINFDLQPELKSLFTSLEPEEIIKNISIALNREITPGKTLLFFDEIQECPKAISALRYFYEKIPQLHIIGAGSLLEFCLNSPDFRMPVGRVQYLYMHPLSFSEFLEALGEDKLKTLLDDFDLRLGINQVIHNKLLKLSKEYSIIGGMPAVITEYLNARSSINYQNVQLSILQTYRDDFGKYASRVKHNHLRKVFNTAPIMVGQRYKYSNVDDHVKSRELKEALELLVQANVISKICSTSGHGLPFLANIKERKFKIIFLDIGLMQRACGLDSDILMRDDLLAINSGAVAEQLIGQELLAYRNIYEEPLLFFWVRDKKNSNAELDYLVQVKSNIVPIEVKSGKAGTLKSLNLFMKEHGSKIAVRFSQLPLQFADGLLSIPIYAVRQMPRLVEQGAIQKSNRINKKLLDSDQLHV